MSTHETAASLRARILTGYALCAIAESHIRAGEMERALKTLRAIREMIAESTKLLSEPYTHSAVRETAELLPELESRVAKLEAALG